MDEAYPMHHDLSPSPRTVQTAGRHGLSRHAEDLVPLLLVAGGSRLRERMRKRIRSLAAIYVFLPLGLLLAACGSSRSSGSGNKSLPAAAPDSLCQGR